MGNRAVITTKENFENNGIGIYLHYNGGRDSVEAFLTYCKIKGCRNTTDDPEYSFARLVQTIANFFGGTTSIGIGLVNDLDCNNGDNGVYIVEDWKIVGRKYFDGAEQYNYPLQNMLITIDNSFAKDDRIGIDAIGKYFAENSY